MSSCLSRLAPDPPGLPPSAPALVVREPIGVVGCVLPWNVPLLMTAWEIGPALAAGCSVILKPVEQTSMTALRGPSSPLSQTPT